VLPNTADVSLDPRIERAVVDHLGMADSIAWAYISKLAGGVDGDEIRSVAAEAVCEAGAKWISYCKVRGFSPWREDDPDQVEGHFGAYVTRIVRGRIYDWARHEDHVTRQNRARLKQLAALAADGEHRSVDELAAATGLSAEQIRAAQAADAVKPVSLEAHTALLGNDHSSFADDAAPGVESVAAANAMLAGMLAAFDALPPLQQVLVALTFHRELALEVAAKTVHLGTAEAREQLDRALVSIHQALLRTAEAEGTGPRRPAPAQPGGVRHVSSADRARVADSGTIPEGKRCSGCGRWLPASAFSWRNRQRGWRVPYCGECDRMRQRRYSARAAQAA
jgi:DNA-directed RNA polymerase specialized sigma24 family protein